VRAIDRGLRETLYCINAQCDKNPSAKKNTALMTARTTGLSLFLYPDRVN
jgi:hypothetical protein